MAKQNLTPKSQDFRKWYTEVIQAAKLADYSPVKGSMVLRPNGYGLWENLQKAFDPMLKKLGVKNAYFPLFIPMSLLQKEADHVEGFAPELAVVTHGGGEELEEKLAIRPTSETIMYEMYSKWIQSHRDLPMNLNQWNNVVRWEKRTYFFLRTTEFLWQEAHTAHASHEESEEMVLDALAAYKKLVEEYLAIPVISGKKSASERFAGADNTTCIEAMMPDGKALQAGTSHDLGQNFSKKDAFDISFQDKEGKTAYAWQTSFGLSTRILGALVMLHGDDDGLVLPPKIAPVQIKLISASPTNEKVTNKLNSLAKRLSDQNIRVEVDTDEHYSLGWKLNEAELQGIPLVAVLGERDLNEEKLELKIRHNGEKQFISISELTKKLSEILDKIQKGLFTVAKNRLLASISEVNNYEEFKKVLTEKRGFLRAFWCEDTSCEKQIKEETKATTRCLEFTDTKGNVKEESGNCIHCDKPSKHRWLFAQAY